MRFGPAFDRSMTTTGNRGLRVPNSTVMGPSLSRRFLSGLRRFLLNPYHYLAVPMILLIGVYPDFYYNLLLNGTWTSRFNYSSPVFPVTYVTALGVFLLLLLGLRKEHGWIVAGIYAVCADLGAVGLYELVFEGFWIQSNPFPFKFFVFTLALSGLVSYRSWRIAPIELWLLVGWVSLFFAWAYVDPHVPRSTSDTVPLLFNAATKVWSFALYSVPLALGVRRFRTGLLGRHLEPKFRESET